MLRIFRVRADGVVGRLSLGEMAGHDGTPDHSRALDSSLLQIARIEVSAASKAAGRSAGGAKGCSDGCGTMYPGCVFVQFC